MIISVDEFTSFRSVKDFPNETINKKVLNTVSQLNEKTQLEPFIRSSIFDINDTPHGPVEVVDILTTKVKVNFKIKYSAFILKGKSFKRITAQDVSHQIYRLTKINNLEIAVFAYTGNLLDQPHEEFISTCNSIGCDYSIWNNYDIARILVSEGFICPRDGNIIEGKVCECGYHPRGNVLNIFQDDAIRELKTSHELKQTKGIIILPTGSGKTRVAVMDIKEHGYKSILYVAHTHEILNSAINEFRKHFKQDEIKIIVNSDDFQNLEKINFVTNLLLINHYEELNKSSFDYIIIDEFHHAAAKSYQKILEYFKYDFLLGLTATPFREDRIDIVKLCDNNVIVNYELKDGINSGILSPYHYYGCFDDIDYTKIKYKGEQYDIQDLEKALIIEERNDAIIKKWQEKAANMSTIAFCYSQLHAERCHQSFKKQNIPSATYISTTNSQERFKIIEDFRNGVVKIIFTVDVLNEGVDFPFVECLLFLRPTDSRRIFLQQLGRGLRRFHGKSKTIVLDFIGNFINAFKIVDYFGLEGTVEENTGIIYSQKTFKEIFNLPLGCEIHFEDKVITLFGNQYLDKRNITKHNIYRILMQQFYNLCIRLETIPTWKQIDRYCVIKSSIYKMFFKSTKMVAKQIKDKLPDDIKI